MASFKECRHHIRLTVQWPLLYANKELIGQGTLLSVSHWESQVGECKVAGTIPVTTGMVLKLWISPTGAREGRSQGPNAEWWRLDALARRQLAVSSSLLAAVRPRAPVRRKLRAFCHTLICR